jgi:HAD superfamily hydrolase (TIGR01509 family)
MRKLSALIFDFDGLLIDTETTALRAWREEFQARGVPLPAQLWRAVAGTRDSRTRLLAYLRRETGPFDANEVLKSWHARQDAAVAAEDLRDGVRSCLDAAAERGLRLAVASSATGDWVYGHLARVGVLDRFDVISCGDDHLPKPHPEVYLATVAALGVHAGEAVAFEDSPPGVAAAKAAGLYCVAVPNPATAMLSFEQADRVTTSFTLPERC